MRFAGSQLGGCFGNWLGWSEVGDMTLILPQYNWICPHSTWAHSKMVSGRQKVHFGLGWTIRHHCCHILLTKVSTRPTQIPGLGPRLSPLMEEAARSHCKDCALREKNNLCHFLQPVYHRGLVYLPWAPPSSSPYTPANWDPCFPNRMPYPFRIHVCGLAFLDLKCLFHSPVSSPLKHPLKYNFWLQVKRDKLKMQSSYSLMRT